MLSNQNETSLIASHYVLPIITDEKLGRIHSIFENGMNVKVGDRLAFLGKGSHPIAGLGINFSNESLLDRWIEQLDEGNLIKFKRERLVAYAQTKTSIVQVNELEEANLNLPGDLSLTENQRKKLEQALDQLNPFQTSGFNDGGFLRKTLENYNEGAFSTPEFIEKAIGLGIGLTPSGDDFIQGMMLMEYVYSEDSRIYRWVEERLDYRSTTDVSLGYYDLLFNGVASHEVWLKFLKKVPSASDEELYALLKRLRRYGHSSGSDMLLGIQHYVHEFM